MNKYKVNYLCEPVLEWSDDLRTEKRTMLYAVDCNELLEEIVKNSECSTCVHLAKLALVDDSVRVVIENYDTEFEKHVTAIV